MAELLKDRFFTKESVSAMIKALGGHYPPLDTDRLSSLIYDPRWTGRELMDKTHHVTACLYQVLPESFDEAVGILKRAAPEINGWEAMCLPDYVENYGREHWDLSMDALAEFTKYSSSEFAIRPFLKSDPDKTIAYMCELAEHENEHVRRFASEGCRPRLPWSMALPRFKKDPAPILPILEKLKNDESEYVRRSVANNLNDISKDNPEIVLDLAERWFGQSVHTDRIIKHACRTLLKAGDRRGLALFGYGETRDLSVVNFQLKNKTLTLGDTLFFSFDLQVRTKKETKVRMEYGVHFVKAKGESKRKVFQISEKLLPPGDAAVSKSHKFIDRTTRKHYGGTHCISIIINGEEKHKEAFILEI